MFTASILTTASGQLGASYSRTHEISAPLRKSLAESVQAAEEPGSLSTLVVDQNLSIPTSPARLRLLALRTDNPLTIRTNDGEGVIELSENGSFLWPIGDDPLVGTDGNPLTESEDGLIESITLENHGTETANLRLDALVEATP
jgi:hypothetical protein